ncbi:hypothetical protein ACFZCY_18585 [Streptomyces sp. NPDC007983]|uniref:hypothetical protein n=1 Tax=Streptomyces sp. NPDC007983 TaxID=3364800 RepID=UPI0036E3E519
MDSTEQKLDQQFAQLQHHVGACHAEVLKCSTDDDQFEVEYERLVEAADELVEFEKTIPERIAEPKRKRSERIVVWSWRGQAGVGAGLIALTFAWDRSFGWLFLLVPHFVGTMAGCFHQKVDADRHLHCRKVAVGLHVVAVLVALVSLSLISLWFLPAIILGWMVVLGASMEDSETSGKARP